MIEFDYKPGKRKAVLVCDRDVFNSVRNHFSVPNEGAYFAKKKGYRHVPDRKYMLTPTGMFDFGLYEEIEKYLIELQITDISYTEEFEKRRNVIKFDSEDFVDNLKYPARYYQKDSVMEALRNGCGTVVLATGAGKSLSQALLLENYIKQNPGDFKCLIIVPGLSLVHQLCGDFEENGVSFSYSPWTGNDPLQDTSVIVCNSENLLAKFKENLWIKKVDVVIQDECHKIKRGKETTKIVSKIDTTKKFGFTGTLSEDLGDRWTTIGTFGPVVYEKKSKELRDEKYLSDIKVYMLKFQHGKTKKMTYTQEFDYIKNHVGRNEKIVDIASKLNGNVLVIVDRLEHGENIQAMMDGSFFVRGDMPISERREITDMMEEKNDVVCIAMAAIFSTGINIKNLPNIIFTYGGKSFIRTIQSVGRGVRLHENKKRLTIIDCYDNLKYSERHALERLDIYEKEEIAYSNDRTISI